MMSARKSCCWVATILALVSATVPGQSTERVRTEAPEPRAAAVQHFVRVLAMADKSRRAREIATIIKLTKAPVAGWERALAKLPRPLLASKLDVDQRGPGTLTLTVPLWCGENTGVLDTQIVVYRPRDLKEGELVPLIVASHGSGGTADGAVGVWQRVAERQKICVVAATEQLQNRGHAGSEHERVTQISLRRWALLHLPVDPSRVFKTGISRGGHITWDVVTRWPDLWAAAAPLIGGPRLDPTGGINNLRLVENLVHLKVRDLQGVGDDPGLIFNLKLAFRELDKYAARDAKLFLQKGHGHSYDPSAVDWNEFYATRRDDLPSEIVFRSVNLEQSRCHWLRITKFDNKIVKDAYRPRAKQSTWNSLDNNGRKKWVAADAEKRTARVRAKLEGDAKNRTILIEAIRGVRQLEALLPRALWPLDRDGRELFVKRGSTRRKLAPQEDLETWLEDIAERVDPTTAAVARCRL